MENESQTFDAEAARESIASRIFVVAGIQVMLDSDIAILFELPVRRINEQRKRNPDRFPKDFRFSLSQEECFLLRSQIAASSSWGGRRYLPYAYAEQGIIALAGVLRSGVAN